MSEVCERRRDLAWRDGREAALACKPRDTNDRQLGTIYADDWWDGFDHGKREREFWR